MLVEFLQPQPIARLQGNALSSRDRPHTVTPLQSVVCRAVKHMTSFYHAGTAVNVRYAP